MAGKVESSVVNGVLIIKLNRAEKLNALDEEMWSKLGELIQEGCGGGYKAVILTGEGRAFSAGDDIGAMYRLMGREEAERFFGKLAGVVEAMSLCPKPVIAAVNGIAAGGGAELLLLADAVVGVRDAWISYPEAYIGLIPPILLVIGIDVVGPRKAKYLALSGHRISMEEAYEMGLVDYIANSKEEMMNAALILAETLSKIPEQTVREIKRLAMKRYREYMEDAMETLIRLSQEEEPKRLMKAFLEKRRT